MDITSLPKYAPRRPGRTAERFVHFILQVAFADAEEVNFVQVGANDGQLADPLYESISTRNWSGVLIEPHPVYFSELMARHNDSSRLQLENVAVSRQAGSLTLYHLNESAKGQYPRWLRGCASFDRSRMENAVATAHLKGAPEPSANTIVGTEVPVRRLDEVLSDADIRSFDLLVVDVEGHERSVMESFDVALFGPKMALVECNGGDIESEQAIAGDLMRAGLTTFRVGDELVGIDEARTQVPASAVFHFLQFEKVQVQSA